MLDLENTQPLSRHILIIDIFQIMFTVFHIYSNPFYTIGLQYQATWRALCLGLRIRHVSRGEGESFVPQNPLLLRDRVPSSLFLRPELPPVSRPACLRFSRSAYLRFLLRPSCLLSKARVPSVFEVLVPSFRVFLFATQKSSRALTQILITITPVPLKQENTVTLTVIHYCIIIVVLL